MPGELELLQKIAENTGSNSSMHIAFVAGGSAVAGALVSAVLSYFGIVHTIRAQTLIERQKLQASVVTTERLRWLQDLRSKVAAFYARIEMQLSHLERPVNVVQSDKYQETLDALSMEVMSQCYAIFPMLDTEKEEQSRLRSALDSSLIFARARFAEKTYDEMRIEMVPFAALKVEAFSALEEIGRKAWKKVQALE
jgi:hypothetical protein